MIYVIFYKSTSKKATFLDKLIAFGTRSIYSHAEILFKENDKFYQASVSPRDIKVRIKEHVFNEDSWDYFKVTKKINEQKCLEYIHSRLGTKYDWLALVGFITRLSLQIESRDFCSEFCTDVLNAGGLKLFNFSESFKVSPAMLADNILLKKIDLKNIK